MEIKYNAANCQRKRSALGTSLVNFSPAASMGCENTSDLISVLPDVEPGQHGLQPPCKDGREAAGGLGEDRVLVGMSEMP